MEESISPRLTLSFQPKSASTSAAPSTAPVVSRPGAVGTREDTSISMRQGIRSRDFNISLSPASPATLAISIRSAIMVVVPLGTTTSANASGDSMVDSKCMWESIIPGMAYRLPQSFTCFASRWMPGSMETMRFPFI